MKRIIKSQYKASLAMLKDAIAKCRRSLWADGRYDPPFWRIAYHTLFYTDLYMSETEEAFKPWAKHVAEYNLLEPTGRKGGKAPKEAHPYTKQELLEYHALIVRKLGATIDQLDLDGSSGFSWLRFGKLELQFYNIRHIEHHAGQLGLMLRVELGQEIEWVGTA